MRKTFLMAAPVAFLILFPFLAQAQSIPDAPQPQKKPVPKAQTPPQPPADSSAPAQDAAPVTPAAKNDNAFPEDVSRAAAKAAAQADGSQSSASDTQAGSSKPAKDGNAFPEDVSRAAAKAAQEEKQDSPDKVPAVVPKDHLSPGESSSQSSSSMDVVDVPANEVDPVRAKKDLDVGGFYLKSGDYKGALLRFKDATASDPTNVDAIFGLAETQRMLKDNAEAARNYQMYLAIVPDGPKARQAAKALKALSTAN